MTWLCRGEDDNEKFSYSSLPIFREQQRILNPGWGGEGVIIIDHIHKKFHFSTVDFRLNTTKNNKRIITSESCVFVSIVLSTSSLAPQNSPHLDRDLSLQVCSLQILQLHSFIFYALSFLLPSPIFICFTNSSWAFLWWKLVLFFCLCCKVWGILVPWTFTPAVEAQRLNHWITSEDPGAELLQKPKSYMQQEMTLFQ